MKYFSHKHKLQGFEVGLKGIATLMTYIAPPKILDFYLFADDTNLLYAEKDLKKLEIIFNEELLKLSEWLNSNKLSLNPTKSNFVIFHPYQRQLNYKN